MSVFLIKKRKLIIILMVLVFIITIFKISSSFAMQSYYKLDFQTGLVTATNLYVRNGPGGVGDWYVVQVEGDYIGAVNKKYVKPIYPNSSGGNISNTNKNNQSSEKTTNVSLTSDEQEVFNLINQQRINNGLSALKIDAELQRVARIKAKDMVDSNYFSHTSPTYGSPFDMMKSFKISYKTAGENIAGNSSNSSAVTAWMNSPGHKANILNGNFNYTGIGVVSGSKYGKIYVQMFIGK